VGETITAPVCCDDSAAFPTEEATRTEALTDGTMVLVGAVSDFHHSQPAWLIDTGTMTVAWRGKYPGPRVRFSGKLWEERHGPDNYSVPLTGRITGIRWHKAVYEHDRDGYQVVGYEDGKVIYNTSKYPGYPPPDEPKRARFREEVKSGEIKGPFTFKSVPMDDFVPSGWAFEFIIETSDGMGN
jgi:hypothetical protein